MLSEVLSRLLVRKLFFPFLAQGKSLAPIPESEEEFEEEDDNTESSLKQDGKMEEIREKDEATSNVGIDKENKVGKAFTVPEVCVEVSSEQGRGQNSVPKKSTTEAIASKTTCSKESSEQHSKGWQSIPKPKGHSALDYARWDNVEDDSSGDDDDEDDDNDESTPQCRFRVRTVGVRPVR